MARTRQKPAAETVVPMLPPLPGWARGDGPVTDTDADAGGAAARCRDFITLARRRGAGGSTQMAAAAAADRRRPRASVAAARRTPALSGRCHLDAALLRRLWPRRGAGLRSLCRARAQLAKA